MEFLTPKFFSSPLPPGKGGKKNHVMLSWNKVSREQIEVESYIIQVKLQTTKICTY